MKPDAPSRPLVVSDRLYSWMLRAYPSEFGREYGAEMAQVFRACCREAYATQGIWGVLHLWLATMTDLSVTALDERTKESFMNRLSSRDLEKHVTILGWLYLIGSGLAVLLGSGAYIYFMLRSDGGTAAGGARSVAIMGLAYLGLILLTIPGFLAGDGLLKRKRRGKILALIIGFLIIANHPIGTALGLYTFWVLLQESATDYFGPHVTAQA